MLQHFEPDPSLERKDGFMPETREHWIEVRVTAPAELSDAISSFITDLGSQGVIQEETVVDTFDDIEEGETRGDIKAYFADVEGVSGKLDVLARYLTSLSELFPGLDAPVMNTEAIADPGWEEQWKKYFKPLRISRDIVIKPTWERYAPVGRDIVIDIDPGMAFGTGQHPSTRMCINAMEDLLPKDRSFEKWSVLDVGTGTGILAITAAKLGAHQVVAVDLDLKAVEIAEQNADINRVRDRIEILNRDVTTFQGRFHLIVANLTAPTLLPIRSHLFGMLENGGYLILSGIIEKDAPLVEETFLMQEGVVSHQVLKEKEWVCFIFKKRSETP